jgi:hypothetical protein
MYGHNRRLTKENQELEEKLKRFTTIIINELKEHDGAK